MVTATISAAPSSIAVAMEQPPGALLAAEDMRYPHRQRDGCIAPTQLRLGALDPDAEGKVAICARTQRNKLNASQPSVCEVASG